MVEKYWDDITIYFVEYFSKTSPIRDGKLVVVNETFIFQRNLGIEDVTKCIQQETDDLLEIIRIDEFAEGMSLKKSA